MIENIKGTIAERQHEPFTVDALDGKVLSYGEFHRLAAGLSAALAREGVRRGDRVAVTMDSSAGFAAIYFACLYMGAVIVPINPGLHKREIAHILSVSGAGLVVCSPETTGIVPEGSGRVICLAGAGYQAETGLSRTLLTLEDAAALEPDTEPLDGVDESGLFSITFTSGTTSMPKGVPHKVGNLLGCASVFNDAVGINADSRFFHVFPMSYMAGFLNTLLCPFIAGASVVISRAFDAKLALSFWDAPMKYGVDTLWLSPSIVASLVRMDRNPAGAAYARDNIKTACIGTAPLPDGLKREFEERYGFRLLESYGLSETLFLTTNTNSTSCGRGSVGRPLDGVGIKAVRDGGSAAGPGEAGEIHVRTPYVMAGYLDGATGLPDSGTVPDWFPTGDVGYISPDGCVHITDRKKDLIIRGGINISPRAVEEVLCLHESVAQAAVVGLPHGFYGEEVAAVLVLKPGYSLDSVRQDIERLCRENLSPNTVPTKYFEVDALPASSTGKVRKYELRERLAALSTAVPGSMGGT